MQDMTPSVAQDMEEMCNDWQNYTREEMVERWGDPLTEDYTCRWSIRGWDMQGWYNLESLLIRLGERVKQLEGQIQFYRQQLQDRYEVLSE